MTARIEIENASVSYFMRKTGNSEKASEQGAVGAQILVGKRYLEITALRNISLSLKTGDRVGLIGINGSGKSTLLKVCAGALAVQSGSITIEGRISPQFALGSGIKPDLSGRRNAELKCLYMGTPQSKIAGHVEEVKELSGLGGYFELPVRSYSAGMRSRLVMSLMRLVRGDILVMDEWISAADASVNKTVSKLQSELIASSSILVMASHSQRILEDWTETLLWLDRGEVKAMGPVSEIYAEYKKWMETRK
ncbi:ABC transporter ATP-binding protein [Pelagibacterium xiamenense]|uniref:ABC transporter ATP-binding protein n=1 Tax=Pelagibacterium xiamenense TaxID=2901140 RepID=UPI001E4B3197|nr:ATP-binding cassette domain-containing protein [Pelagibacterium xiamenense]MCD7061410.1 ATP-binding cassette domain-containing protein [Pelagibacterium xiamenense]